ncbi:hypothetical protein ACHQM5_000585 [Ranunculus cassubicifolius]
MKVPMGPPPPKLPNPPSPPLMEPSTSNPPSIFKVPMGPPPPKIPDSIPNPETLINSTEEQIQLISNVEEEEEELKQVVEIQDPIPKPKESKESFTVPYTIPPWSEAPCHPFFLEVLKDGTIIEQLNVMEKGAYMFGRVELCDFVLDHPTISRFHAVMQFKQSGEAYIYDLGSTHGTSVNKNQVMKKVYTELHVGDVIRFGHSSRLYVFQGPTELMPPEGDLKKIRSAKIREDMHDREASLLRAKQQASLADGISWGMTEDAIEEAEEDTEEITWQTFKGQLTERQQKTREKVIKRMEKIANMKKEIEAIRVKDIPQGGLTQGQQTQIARNEQRIVQILEELESLEETLNESIQESIGARSGKIRSKKKGGPIDDEDEASSDDDEFYDRTKKPATQKAAELEAIETADSLLDKKDVILREIENKQKLINEKSIAISTDKGGTEDGDSLDAEDGDSLDAYMTDLSSKLVLDSTTQLESKISTLQSELDKILFLLRIADPSGQAAKKRESEVNTSECFKAEPSTSTVTKLLPPEKKKSAPTNPPSDAPAPKLETPQNSTQVEKISTYTVTKPQWLGAVHETEREEKQPPPLLPPSDVQDSDQFVDYKDRKSVLGTTSVDTKVETSIEGAAPGLIIRKRKKVEKPIENVTGNDNDESASVSMSEAQTTAADAMALLLKHSKGLVVPEEEEQIGKDNNNATKCRRVLGPEKPEFLNSKTEYEGWVPPKGQSGDGRTSLNDRFGY